MSRLTITEIDEFEDEVVPVKEEEPVRPPVELNDDQKDVLTKLKDFVNKESNPYWLLEGCAGSGKTTTVTEFVKYLVNHTMINKIAMAAPTHKAVKVMKKMAPFELKKHLAFLTLHSLLGLKHSITADGKEIYVKDKYSASKILEFDLIIVDEASMIADELFSELDKQNYRGVKVLFVGDRNQINPINHIHSIPMLDEMREKHKIGRCELTKIVRQAEGNPIIQMSQRVLNGQFKFRIGVDHIIGNSGVTMLDSGDTNTFVDLLKGYFCTEKFDKDSDYCRLIAWRNVSVAYFNTIIRKLKYGPKVDKIVIGEKLIVKKPIKNFEDDDDDDAMFHTNEDLNVLEIKLGTKALYGGQYKYYDVLVAGDECTNNIHILHEDSTALYDATLKKLADEAKNEKVAKALKWKKYYKFMENFASIDYGYSHTCHVGQGSTYDNVFVFYNDIVLNRREDERQRILYTAMTRPRNNLYLF